MTATLFNYSYSFKQQKKDASIPPTIKKIVIVGGGTAGWMTAMILANSLLRQGVEISLVESPVVGIIGVGEGSTPWLRGFFDSLGIEEAEWMPACNATYKCGITFDKWSTKPGFESYFHPFASMLDNLTMTQFVHNAQARANGADLHAHPNRFFIASRLAEKNMAPKPNRNFPFDVWYGYHFDAVLVGEFLHKKAVARGVKYQSCHVTHANLNERGEIASIATREGETITADFFVDCSCFKSLLINKVMGSPYISFNKSLCTDTAVTGSLANFGKVKPYTYAESMNNGWCWNISMRNSDHRGYVFSSEYCSVDEAADELKSKNPGIDDLKIVKFKSGRHQDISIGNVFAIGNSYAFVEPLESTGIHMIIKEIKTLTAHFSFLKRSPSLRTVISSNMNDHWDYLKGFLAIHYKYNNKFQSRFWNDCREMTDISSIKWIIDLYHEVGLLSYAGDEFKELVTRQIKDDIFGLTGFDTLLFGQGVMPEKFGRSVRNRGIWEANVNTWKSIQTLTVPLKEDLEILMMNPELI